MSSSHQCPGPECGKEIPQEMLACRPHWFQVPKDIRAKVWHEYRKEFGSLAYLQARHEAISCMRKIG